MNAKPVDNCYCINDIFTKYNCLFCKSSFYPSDIRPAGDFTISFEQRYDRDVRPTSNYYPTFSSVYPIQQHNMIIHSGNHEYIEDYIFNINSTTGSRELRENLSLKYVNGTEGNFPVYNTFSSVSPTYGIEKGTVSFGLIFDCSSCRRYSFVMQLWANIYEMYKVSQLSLILNSETLRLNQGNKIHNVKNIYSSNVINNKTIYCCSLLHENGRQTFTKDNVEFPFIEIDRNNPDKIIQRVRDLLIYI